jgi:serine/threonine-protein kinase
MKAPPAEQAQPLPFSPGEMAPGATLDGRFQIIDIVSRGGMAVLYKATDLESGRLVAVKVPLMRYESDPLTYSRFQREEELGARLQHPHIVGVIPTGRSKSRPYLVMEYLEGRPLNKIIAEGRPMAEADVLRVALQLCEALECLREKGIVHRDLKPENIMVGEDSTVRILDFGIAKAGWLRRLTMAGLKSTLGTPDYMAPEQVLGRRGDHRTDIYSLGAIVYEMATGRPPFPGDSAYVVMNSRTAGDPDAPRSANPEISPALEEVILHALEREPESRYATAGEMKADLENLSAVSLTGRHRRLKPVRGVSVSESPWIMRGLLMAAAFIALQLAAFGGIFWYLSVHGHR